MSGLLALSSWVVLRRRASIGHQFQDVGRESGRGEPRRRREMIHANWRDAPLFEAGLVVRTRVDTGGSLSVVLRLTDKGREWARLLTALGDVPDYAAPLTHIEPCGHETEGDDDIPF